MAMYENPHLQGTVEWYRFACAAGDHEIQQILGTVLGFPRYCDDQANFPGSTPEDGVFAGEHVGATLAAMAARQIREMRTMLAAIEWVYRHDSVSRCPFCTATRQQGHHAGCWLAAVLGPPSQG